jgi:leucyl/phenylalanyl-tRNA--protein transferase
MIAAYEQLHAEGHAHSVETWKDGQLAGGVYGIAIGGLFAAESMFRFQRDASKVALFHLHSHLRKQGYVLLDIQQLTPHTASLGAVEISRRAYLQRLADAIDLPVMFGKLEGGTDAR